MSTAQTYSLTFEGGILSGFDLVDVKARSGGIFRLGPEQIEQIFNGSLVELKGGLPEVEARRFSDRLQAIGMNVEVRAAASAPPPEAAAPTRPLHHATPEELEFEFRGAGGEFFRIWIVNIFLTIITLGIYSAWAKVRTNRYFYGNTRLNGEAFEYLADPIRILKGRIVAAVLLAIYLLAERFSPVLALVMFLLFLLLLPWIVCRSLAFRNHNSAWRGIRFGFAGSLGESYKAFLLWPILGVLSLGLLFPYAAFQQIRFAVNGARFGTSPFAFDATAGTIYRAFLKIVLLGVVCIGLVTLTMFLAPLGILVVMAGAWLAIFAFAKVLLTNITYNNSALGEHLFEADYQLGSYSLLVLTNTLAVVLTLGLFYPWAKVRNARYAAQHVRVISHGDADVFVADQRRELSALGSEVGDLFDVDI